MSWYAAREPHNVGEHITYQIPIDFGATIAVPNFDSLTAYDAIVGGAFRAKCAIWPHTMIAAAAARHFQVTVKLALDREQMFHGMGYRARLAQRRSSGAAVRLSRAYPPLPPKFLVA